MSFFSLGARGPETTIKKRKPSIINKKEQAARGSLFVLLNLLLQSTPANYEHLVKVWSYPRAKLLGSSKTTPGVPGEKTLICLGILPVYNLIYRCWRKHSSIMLSNNFSVFLIKLTITLNSLKFRLALWSGPVIFLFNVTCFSINLPLKKQKSWNKNYV